MIISNIHDDKFFFNMVVNMTCFFIPLFHHSTVVLRALRTKTLQKQKTFIDHWSGPHSGKPKTVLQNYGPKKTRRKK